MSAERDNLDDYIGNRDGEERCRLVIALRSVAWKMMETEGETWRKSEGEENGKKKNGAGEAFALRPGMKIVLLLALREGREPSIISALARATKGRGQALSLSLSLFFHSIAINARHQ